MGAPERAVVQPRQLQYRLPPDADPLLVSAEGYDVAAVPLPIVDPSPITVRLEPANRLRIRVDGEDLFWGGLATEVATVGPLLSEGARQFPHEASIAESEGWEHWWSELHRPTTPSPYNFLYGERGSRMVFPYGEATLHGVVAGQPITIRLTDEFSDVVIEERVTLGPREQRDVVLRVPAPRTLAGRIVDPQGRPVPRAFVCLSGRHMMGRTGRCDDQGAFSFGGLLGDRVDLSMYSADGFARAEWEGLEVPADGAPVDLTVHRTVVGTRRLSVLVRDAQGAPFDAGYVSARRVDRDAVHVGREVARDGGTVSLEVTEGPLEVSLIAGATTVVRQVQPAESLVVVTLPATGSLLVRLPGQDPDDDYAIDLTPPGRDGPVHVEPLAFGEYDAAACPYVPPGRYRLRLIRWDEWSRAEVPVGEAEVTVVEGVESDVTFALDG